MKLFEIKIRLITITFKLIWFDAWRGFFWETDSLRLYICPLPCVVFCIDLWKWGINEISMGTFENTTDINTIVENLFLIFTFVYYILWVSVIMVWITR